MNADDPHPTSGSVFNHASRFGPSRSRQICLNPVWRVGCEGSRSDPERSEGERSEAEDRSSPAAKLDTHKFGDEDQTGGLIESCTSLKFPPWLYTTGPHHNTVLPSKLEAIILVMFFLR